MERAKEKPVDSKRIQVLSELVNRALFASRLGMDSYNGDRDIYQALGYPTIINFDDYLSRYIRQDIAKAVIDRPVKVTWQGPLELIESDQAEDTEFEKAWKVLDRKLGIKTRLARVDRLTGIGRYGILLLGLDDIRNLEGYAQPVKAGARKLIYLKPFSEKSARIKTYESQPTNPRYGLPLLYEIDVADVSSGSSATVSVHYTRLIHIVDNNLESEIVGTPRLEAIYNRLMDLEKLVGGSAEMFWRGARPGYQGKLDPNYSITNDVKESLKDQVDEFENNLRRILINEGVDLEALAQQVSDPKNSVDVQLTMISAVTGIPKRILSGSERGELASTQDTGEWLSWVQARREDQAETSIVRPFVDRIIELGILPAPTEDYTVKWQDLFSISEKDRVDIGKARANALREYTTNPLAAAVMPPNAFMEMCMGLNTEQITLVNAMRESEMQEEIMDVVMDGIDAKNNPSQGGFGASSQTEVPVSGVTSNTYKG
jgi:uncharacterized protein